MLASLSGSLALLLGLAVMLLPLLSPELSRPRDSAWGGLVVLLGLTLVTSADRLSGSPMLAVLCGGLLIGRLGGEVMQLRWSQLTPEEQQGLITLERWQRSLSELGVSVGSLVGRITVIAAGLGGSRPRTAGRSKRWVRPEPAESAPAGAANEPSVEAVVEAAVETTAQAGAQPPVQPTVEAPVTVRSFAEIDVLISAAAKDDANGAEQPAETDQLAEDPTDRPMPHSEAG